MLFRFISRSLRPAAVAAAIVAGGQARAQLSAQSPFAPADSGAAAQADPNALEYRGKMSSDRGPLYLIYDPVKKLSAWVGLNEAGSPYSVRLEDVPNDRITLRVNGQEMVLPLHSSKVAEGPQINLANFNAPPPIGGPAILHPTPEDEQRRLQSVADEVRRRRQEREKASQAAAGGAAP
jgi:hypothetical protein